MQTVKMQLNKIKKNPNNPRTIKDANFKKLVKSLKDFPEMTEIRPVVVNKDMVILGGNMRYEACKAAGYKEVDVIVATNLTPEQEKEFIIKDNVSGGDWDFDMLANDFDLDDLFSWGFDEKELNLSLWQTQTEEELDEVPETPKETVSKLGDLFLIDSKHRVLCGDSTKEEDVARLMDGHKTDMVFTDPPYGVSYADKNKYLNSISRGNRIQTPIVNDHLTLSGTANSLILPAFKQIKNILSDHSSYYITAPQGGELLMMMMMMMMMKEAGLILRHMLIWAKNNHVLGRTDYNYKHEPILYGWVERHNFYGGGEQRFSVWNYDKPLKNDLHPTMKPVKLICNAILNSTQRENNIVADIFLGSGSTLIACEQTKRICYGMELDEKYCDVILNRYKKLYPESKFECLNNPEFNFKKLFDEKQGLNAAK